MRMVNKMALAMLLAMYLIGFPLGVLVFYLAIWPFKPHNIPLSFLIIAACSFCYPLGYYSLRRATFFRFSYENGVFTFGWVLGRKTLRINEVKECRIKYYVRPEQKRGLQDAVELILLLEDGTRIRYSVVWYRIADFIRDVLAERGIRCVERYEPPYEEKQEVVYGVDDVEGERAWDGWAKNSTELIPEEG